MTESLKTTLENFKDALSVNASLTAWSKASYGRAHNIYVNIDSRQAPAAEDCPYIMLRPVAARYGRGVSEKAMEFELVCFLYDEAFAQDPETNAIEYRGVQKIMDMLDYAVAAVAGVSTGNALLQDVSAEFETIEFFPFFMAGCPIMLVEPLTLGAVRTTL